MARSWARCGGPSIMSGRRRRSSDGWGDAFSELKKPASPIRLTGVVRSEIVRPSRADSLNVVTRNGSDDKACQGEVYVSECVLDKEHLIGLGEGNDSCDGMELLTTTTAPVFERMGSTDFMNEPNVVTLCFICLLLLSSAKFQLDMACRLLRELLKLRDRQT